ncbi:hypothetical protein DL96DRAFT_1591209, partial [Flagelloscypha sp. PMI_526]
HHQFTLLSTCLTSRSYQAASIPCLYQNVDLYHKDAAEETRRAKLFDWSIRLNPSLAIHVHWLSFGNYGIDALSNSLPLLVNVNRVLLATNRRRFNQGFFLQSLVWTDISYPIVSKVMFSRLVELHMENWEAGIEMCLALQIDPPMDQVEILPADHPIDTLVFPRPGALCLLSAIGETDSLEHLLCNLIGRVKTLVLGGARQLDSPSQREHALRESFHLLDLFQNSLVHLHIGNWILLAKGMRCNQFYTNHLKFYYLDLRPQLKRFFQFDTGILIILTECLEKVQTPVSLRELRIFMVEAELFLPADPDELRWIHLDEAMRTHPFLPPLEKVIIHIFFSTRKERVWQWIGEVKSSMPFTQRTGKLEFIILNEMPFSWCGHGVVSPNAPPRSLQKALNEVVLAGPPQLENQLQNAWESLLADNLCSSAYNVQ